VEKIKPPRKSGLALRTDPGEFQAMLENGKGGQLARCLFYIEIRRKIKVVNPAALVAADMVMDMGFPVETLLGAADIEFLDDPAFGHDLQVAVDRAQADFRQPLAHHLIKYISGGVRSHAAQLIEDDLALSGYPETMIVELRHELSPQIDNNSYYRKIKAAARCFFPGLESFPIFARSRSLLAQENLRIVSLLR